VFAAVFTVLSARVPAPATVLVTDPVARPAAEAKPPTAPRLDCYRVERTSSRGELHPLKSSAFHGALLRQLIPNETAQQLERECDLRSAVRLKPRQLDGW
jgi:hypothetical protein